LDPILSCNFVFFDFLCTGMSLMWNLKTHFCDAALVCVISFKERPSDEMGVTLEPVELGSAPATAANLRQRRNSISCCLCGPAKLPDKRLTCTKPRLYPCRQTLQVQRSACVRHHLTRPLAHGEPKSDHRMVRASMRLLRHILSQGVSVPGHFDLDHDVCRWSTLRL
jgi:hypothetical protein